MKRCRSKGHNQSRISHLIGIDCGHVFPIPRPKTNRENNHIKSIYCPFCRIKRQFIENIRPELLDDEDLKQRVSRFPSVY